MAVALYANNATATLSSSITATSTSVTVTSGQGTLFPAATTGGDYFYATLISSTGTIEIVKVTNKAVDTFTIVRAQDGTTASAFSSGSKFELRIVAAGMNEKLDKGGGTVTNLTATNLTTGNLNATGGTITGITDLAVADGGTGASTAADARSNLGLGSIATQNANSVNITGGSVAGITDLAVVDGGTGASTAADARTNLGLGSLATKSTASLTTDVSGTLPIANGGTGAATAADALTALGALSVAASSITTNGYMRLSNGLMLQWGFYSTSGGEGSYTVTFPTSFPNACFTAVSTIKNGAGTGNDIWVQINSISKTSMSIQYQSGGGNTGYGAYWIAVGN